MMVDAKGSSRKSVGRLFDDSISMANVKGKALILVSYALDLHIPRISVLSVESSDAVFHQFDESCYLLFDICHLRKQDFLAARLMTRLRGGR